MKYFSALSVYMFIFCSVYLYIFTSSVHLCPKLLSDPPENGQPTSPSCLLYTTFLIHLPLHSVLFPTPAHQLFNSVQKTCAKTSLQQKRPSLPLPQSRFGQDGFAYCHFTLEILWNSPLAVGFLLFIEYHIYI